MSPHVLGEVTALGTGDECGLGAWSEVSADRDGPRVTGSEPWPLLGSCLCEERERGRQGQEAVIPFLPKQSPHSSDCDFQEGGQSQRHRSRRQLHWESSDIRERIEAVTGPKVHP